MQQIRTGAAPAVIEPSPDEEIEQGHGHRRPARPAADTWTTIRDCAEQLLTAAEVGGLTGAQLWLNVRGLRW